MAKGKYEYWLTKEGLLLLEAWARDGLTDKQIACKMGISTATLYNYKREHLELLEALKKGKEIVDVQVENALLKRAMGYAYTEVKTEQSSDGTKVTKIIKQVVPDTTAQIYWLKNRKPKEWRDRPFEIENNNGQLFELIKGLKQNE